ncbi:MULTISPECIES: hypothetical protein [unclassified Haladaptatus]|uniref:hypothetical protein n=1 Tax=unclassified Haladaptatus TaxID=2622732 RepID=UPI0023E8F06E|nr:MULTISPECIES: hypothetical protein [unclassified Haladaptatus]
MDVTRSDFVRYMYTLGAVISGVYVEKLFTDLSPALIVAPAAVVSVFWVFYYNYSIAPRIERITDPDASSHYD